MILKICKKCNQEKSLDQFAKNPQCKDGHIGSCRDCIKGSLKKNRKCIACGIEFYSSPKRIKDGYGKYCSDKCKSSGKQNPRYIENNVSCKKCGESFHVKPSQQKSGKSKIYCSIECNIADRRTTVNCRHCNSEFQVQKSKVGRIKYCSSECSKLALLQDPVRAPKSTKLNCACKTCGKKFYTKPSELRRGSGIGTYCSSECMTGSRKAKRIDGLVTSYLEEIFLNQLTDNSIVSGMQRELEFHDKRKWRFDFAWIDKKIAVEIQGGIWLGKSGSHTSSNGFENDCEKRNEAVIEG